MDHPSRRGWWLALLLGSLALLVLSPIGLRPRHAPITFLFGVSNLAFPFILWSFGWHGPLWGLGALSWSAALIGFIGLASREPALLWLPLELCAFGAVVHWGVLGHWAALRSAIGRAGRVAERVNTLEEELRQAEEVEQATERRLQQYQRLRQVANTFALGLDPEEIGEAIVESTGQLVQTAERVLLYGVEPKALILELREVWRRGDSPPIREKQGDAFDHWVMRQGQPLLVEEAARDFRFPEVTPEQAGRPLGSVLAVPLRTPNHSLGVLRLESSAPRGLNADDLRLVGIVADLASLAIENASLYGRMAHLAITDDLTGLAVRSHFESELARALDRAREKGEPLSVLLIDLDRFKVYNDGFGHSAGDKLLRQVGQLLLDRMRPGDLAARYGGEEFVCLLSGAGLAQAEQRAEEIRQVVEQTSVLLRRTITRTSVSIGVAAFPQDGAVGQSLVEAADRRLYRAKELGRNRVCAEG